MMWVILPTGERRQYNDANHALRHAEGYTDIYTRKDGNWIAQIPNTWAIERVPPCCVEAPRSPIPHMEQIEDTLRRSLTRTVSVGLSRRRKKKPAQRARRRRA